MKHKAQTETEAIVAYRIQRGLEVARQLGLTKDADIVYAIQASLDGVVKTSVSASNKLVWGSIVRKANAGRLFASVTKQ